MQNHEVIPAFEMLMEKLLTVRDFADG